METYKRWKLDFLCINQGFNYQTVLITLTGLHIHPYSDIILMSNDTKLISSYQHKIFFSNSNHGIC